MRIVCDMDEVLAQFVNKILHRWNSINGTNFSREDVNMWRMENVLGRDVTGRRADGLIDEWLAEPGFYENLEPIPGAIEGFQRLLDSGHDVVIATSVPEVAVNAFDGKRRWMRKYFPKWSMKNFFSSSRKSLIDGDVLIDDAEHNINDWCRDGKTGALVMDAPWNRDLGHLINENGPVFVHGMPITRVFDWNGILREIEIIAARKNGMIP